MAKRKAQGKGKPNLKQPTTVKPSPEKPAKVEAVVHLPGPNGARTSVRIVS